MSVPKDNAFTNIGVHDRLIVRESISTPTINTQNIVVQQNIVLTENATIVNQSASSNSAVVFTTGDQTISGVKTFLDTPIFANGSFVSTSGDQTIDGSKTFTSPLITSATSNQIVLGPTNTSTTLNAVTPSSSRVYSIQDSGADANFVMSEGPQTVNGATIFGTSISLPTSGGVPTPLSFFEEFSSTLDFTSNAFSGTISIAYNIVRIGSLVVMTMAGIDLTAASGSPGLIDSGFSVIPARFRFTNTNPLNAIFKAYVGATSNSTQLAGIVRTTSASGRFIFSAGPADGNQFAATGNLGINPFTMAWTLI